MSATKEAKKSRLTGEKRTEKQKASDAKRVEKIKATRASRKNSDAITRELKIDWSKLSQRKRRLIKRAGHECNWLYNDIVRYINETDVDENGETVNKNDLKNYDTKIKRVLVKYGDEYRWRQLKVLSSQMKQAIYQQVWNALKALTASIERDTEIDFQSIEKNLGHRIYVRCPRFRYRVIPSLRFSARRIPYRP